MQNNFPQIGFIGAGNMAGAIIGGLIKEHYPSHSISCYAPSHIRRTQLAKQFGINNCAQLSTLLTHSQMIILAVKPQIMAEVCHDLAQFDLTNKIIISLAAGISLSMLAQWLPEAMYRVRAMPNTPTLIGEGVTGLYSSSALPSSLSTIITNLFNTLGDTLWLQREDELNALIAVSGSAPAYLFLFMEAMQHKAEQLGFNPQQATDLIKKTMQGSALLAAHSTLDFKTLREQVTSKGGTTERAISIFQQQHFSTIIDNAMQAALDRATEMESLHSHHKLDYPIEKR